MQNYSKEDFPLLTEEEKLTHLLDQAEAIEKLNEELDIAQDGVLELQKELTLKRHALEENEKLFSLAKSLKEENEELQKAIPTANHEIDELKKQLTEQTSKELERVKKEFDNEKAYYEELIKEYELEIERLKNEKTAAPQEVIAPPVEEINVKAEIQKRDEEIAKIKVIVVQGMKEAKELKNKALSILQMYEELALKKKEQENLVVALQSKLHETTLVKNRYENELKNQNVELEKIQSLLQVTQDSFEKEISLSRQLLAKKVKEATYQQEQMEEMDRSYQEKIQLLITDYQDKIENFQVQTQKLIREKDAALQGESLIEIYNHLEPLLEKIREKIEKQTARAPVEEVTSLVPEWKQHEREPHAFSE